MKIMKTTKIIIVSAVLLSLFLVVGCGKVEPPNASLVTRIEAKVENAERFSSVVAVKLMMNSRNNSGAIELARGDWKNGGFTIEFPKMLNPNYLHSPGIGPFVNINLDMPSTMRVISNKNVKSTGLVFFVGVDKDGNIVTEFRPSAVDEHGNSKNVFYGYFDSDVTISGYFKSMFTIIATEDYKGPWEWTMTESFSIKWKEGWNVWWFSDNATPTTATVTRKYSTNPINKLKWNGMRF